MEHDYGDFIEAVDYASIEKISSIWGEPRDGIIALIPHVGSGGTCLDLGAGDGRYAEILCENFEQVTLLDLDVKALERLSNRVTTPRLPKIYIEEGDVTMPLRHSNASMDFVLCTGLIHYFKPYVIGGMLREVHRVLKPGRSFVFDFSTDVHRRAIDGSFNEMRRGYEYSESAANSVLSQHAALFDFNATRTVLKDQPMLINGTPCHWNSIDLQVKAIKRS